MEKWEKERIDKIERKKKEVKEKMENEFDYIPKINEKSAKIAEKNKRLYGRRFFWKIGIIKRRIEWGNYNSNK